MALPIYTPTEKIEKGLYTSGKELMGLLTAREYIGLYHRFPNGSIYSESSPNERSIELTQYLDISTSENTSVYYQLTGTRFNNYTQPEYYFPILSDADYKLANFTRYFVQQKNNLDQIIEINKESFDNVNNENNRGIDGGLYQKISIIWTITGPVEEVRNANQRAITALSNTQVFEYLTDLLEFYK